MSKRRVRSVLVPNNFRPIPEPKEKNLATGLVFLIASFFNNTQAFDIEHQDRNSHFALRYRGCGYVPRRRR